MTNVKVVRKNGKIQSVKCDGHTGYGVEGEDIVCAALSSIVQTALLGLLQVAGIQVDYVRCDEDGTLEFSLPNNLTATEAHDADIILSTMWAGVLDLHEGFSDFIELED